MLFASRRARSGRSATVSPWASRWQGDRGHVESWFLRLNDPDQPRALWVKATIFAPLTGPALGEAWAIWFDAGKSVAWAARQSAPVEGAAFPDSACTDVACCGLRVGLGRDGRAVGSLERAGVECRFDLTFQPEAGLLGAHATLFPHAWMLEAPVPRSKTLTPWPALRFDGSVTFGGDTVDVRGWRGMHGHNWGREHAEEYAWGQVRFDDAWVEGFTARVRMAGRLTPPISCLVVRDRDREYRWDALIDLWRQRASATDRTWTLALRGPAGEVDLSLDATDRPLACLAYANPDGRTRYCFNSKLARAVLHVRPRDAAPFSRTSEHGGALEFLRPSADGAVEVI
ncbi:MAG: hypothetical protein EXR79_16065 [Myxococcales bacterium]|nr:hypothetical protein [Myxococcales bacterium]